MKKRDLMVFASLGLVIFLLSTCNPPNQQERATALKDSLNEAALVYMQQNCYTCHNPDMEISNRVAPPMFKVQQHYKTEGVNREDFVQQILDFMHHPTIEKSKMPGAVRNFGLMPKQNHDDEKLKLVAGYIFDNDLSSDEWYVKWETFKKIPQAEETSLSYAEMGLKYANATKSELGKNLLGAIKTYGSAGAVEFCNTRAIQLSDSMAKTFNISIKRVSDKRRNPNNKANETELTIIEELKKQKAGGEKLLPKIVEGNNRVYGYYAIETNGMCLQCHGTKGKTINTETAKKIEQLYPNDKAINYTENQIRGIWVVEMQKK